MNKLVLSEEFSHLNYEQSNYQMNEIVDPFLYTNNSTIENRKMIDRRELPNYLTAKGYQNSPVFHFVGFMN
ncbi:hypothetical protein [Paenibacillus sp. IHBB 10380]|uniref:hypothetical protein n=1 Tax=Paenibacillus sp. IHBB 10380 TaxID=1566358 RepID=UPI0005CFCF92|nr:hypothetical protein [Paenibacillus sp. IHBB 10380]AJS59688.1 hypothetical protein UB51_15730 [Paenibacillus sp. IHBB 10380]